MWYKSIIYKGVRSFCHTTGAYWPACGLEGCDRRCLW